MLILDTLPILSGFDPDRHKSNAVLLDPLPFLFGESIVCTVDAYSDEVLLLAS